MAGIVWARFALVPETFCWILIIVLATRLLIGLRRPNGVFGKYLILPLFFLIGGVHTTPFLSPPSSPAHIYNQIEAPQEVVITGTLLEAIEKRSDKSRLVVETEQVWLANATFPGNGKVLLTMLGSPSEAISPGDKIIAKAKLDIPRGFGVPGVFNYASYLANKNIWITGWLSSPYLLRRIHEIPPPNFSTKIRFLPERLRQKIGIVIDETLPPSTAGIYKAILIGDRFGIPPETTEAYKTAGNIHLLAISGLHVGLLAFFLCAGFAWLLKHSETILLRWPVWKTSALLSILPLAMYALIAGFQTPVFRAVIMTYIFMGAIVWDRRDSILNNLALAALILLTINPADLFTVSFQLSFAAVGSIAVIFPRIAALWHVDRQRLETKSSTPRSYFEKVKAFCLTSIFISCAASLGTAPLLAYHFNRVSLLSPVSTLLVEPFLCFWSLILGLVACLLIPAPVIAQGLLHAGGWGIQGANFITKLLAGLPFASVWIPTPSPYEIIVYYIFLLAIFFCLARKGLVKAVVEKIKSHQVGALCSAVIVLFFLFILWPGAKNRSPRSVISVLDVGQGLATVVELPDDQVFIIDGGKQQAGETSRFNVGRDVIAPFLWSKKISKITAIVVSHPDADHANGIPFLMEHFHPDVIWANDAAENVWKLKQIRELAEELAIPLKIPLEGEEMYSKKRISLRTISSMHRNDAGDKEGWKDAHEGKAGNNQSLVVKLAVGDAVCLFPGDIEEGAERRLIEKGADLHADILIAPHHGSKTSSSEGFIRKVAADYVVVSAGHGQLGTFPSVEIVRKYKQLGSAVLTTAISGSIFFIIEDGIKVETFY
jgi:competence protein ComEC